MRLFPPELEIGPEEGFDPEKDLFNRKQFGEQLIKLVRGVDTPLVFLLDGGWGTGKTTFVKMWLGELSKAGVPNIYFDAFANDYHEDAFLTVAGEIIARADELKPKSRRLVRNFRASSIRVAKALGRASLKVGIRAASAGILSGEEIAQGVKVASEVAKAAGDEAAKAVDELLKERLESHRADLQAFEDFRNALTEVAGALSSGKETEQDKRPDPPGVSKQPLVFVIDELDRCRPSFALDLLEKIKHFFTVPGVTFVLVSSLEQLESAARFAYGEIDARTYLEKFYHLRLLFPVVERAQADTAAMYLNYLFAEQNRNEVDIPIAEFCRINPLSLRTLERVVAYSKLVIMSMPENSLKVAHIISGLAIMKVIRPDLYTKARTGTLDYSELQQFFRFSLWHDPGRPGERSHVGERMEDMWRYVLGDLADEEKIRVYSQGMYRYGVMDPSHVVRYYCKLMDGIEFPG